MFARNYKFIGLIGILFTSVLLISNIVSTKIIDFWFFSFDWWTILFPLSYIFWDILTEVYWYRETKKIIWSGFLWLLLLWITIIVVWALPPSPDWAFQTDYENILWLTPRIILASICAYLIWEFTNSYILAKMKILTKWTKMYLRFIWSTIIWEFFDTIIFILIAFYWVFDNNLILMLIVSNYIFKVLVEILFLPLTYKITSYLKKKEKEDYYDKKTNFNPFSISK